MDAKRIYQFLRPALLVVICYALAMLVSGFLAQRAGGPQQPAQDWSTLSKKISSLHQPTPERSPREVVQLQLDGLADDDEVSGVLQCMTFASPGNRLVTGPIKKFAQLVRSGKFRALSAPERTLVGQPTLFDGNARVLVTVVDRKTVQSFVWILSKQSEAPWTDCWMTDGVFPLKIESAPRTPTTPNRQDSPII